MQRTTMAARAFLALTAVVIAFQCALTAGVPWGEFTMGGAFPGTLPPRMRVVAMVSAAVLALAGAIVAARAGLGLPKWHRVARRGIWVVVAYLCVGVVLNAVTPSPRERMLWLPVTVVLAGCALVVARSDRPYTFTA
jgi:hypothetical protein